MLQYRLNSYGYVQGANGVADCGGLIRNCQGRLIVDYCKKLGITTT